MNEGMRNKKAFQVVLNPKFKTQAKQYQWINKHLKLLFPEYYHFEYSITKSFIFIKMVKQDIINGELITEQKVISTLKGLVQ